LLDQTEGQLHESVDPDLGVLLFRRNTFRAFFARLTREGL